MTVISNDFLMDALVDGGVMKRIDLAINDHMGILDIPELAEKCRKREYIGKSRSYKFYLSGELIKHREDDREYMGRTSCGYHGFCVETYREEEKNNE